MKIGHGLVDCVLLLFSILS